MITASFRIRLLATVAGMALVVGVPSMAHGQAGRISGTVSDRASGAPLEGARVVVAGTSLIETTDREGKYTVRSIPAGTYQVRTLRIGYKPQVQSVTVGPSETVALGFALEASPVQLDEIVTTATGEQRKLEVANAVSTIDAASITETQPTPEFGNLISGRAAGVQVLKSGGTTGTGTRIRIRGSNSISLSNEPLFYIDGIRMESNSSSLSIDVGGGIGGGATSRINDLNPDEIESIEIVKGPAAATLYGIQASNGVVRVTTKRGVAGKPRWNAYTEQGAVTDNNTYPINYNGRDTTTATGADWDGFCILQYALDGLCTQTSVSKGSPLRDQSTKPLKAGHRQQYGLNVSGGNEFLTYFFSGDYEDETGVFRLPQFEEDSIRQLLGSVPATQLRPNALQKTSLRANVNTNVSRTAELSASVGYISSDTRLIENDNSFLTITGSGEASGLPMDINRGWYFIPAELFAELSNQSIERFTGGLTGTWRPQSWLSTRATLGYDVVNRQDVQFFPTGQVAAYLQNRDGKRIDNRAQISQTSADFGAVGRFKFSPSLSGKTSAGVQFFRDLSTSTFLTGNGLPAGSSTISGAASVQGGEQTIESRTLGSYVEQEVGVKERLFLTGALRYDDNSAFGRNFKATVYPKASASWLISEEPFFHMSWLSTLRLRGAFGVSGQQPGTNDARQYYTPIAGKRNGVPETGVTFGSLGNPDLKPERSREVELGLDATLLGNRVALELTFYHKLTEDALVLRDLPPSTGTAPQQFFNVGSNRQQGFEYSIDTRLIDNPRLTWDLAFSGSFTSNKVLDLGAETDTIFVGFYQRHVKGYPLGGYWSKKLTGYNDANGDGIIDATEYTVTPNMVYIGSALPTREASLNSSVTLFGGWFRLGTQWDYRGGHMVDNSIENFRCTPVLNCRGLVDRSAPLQDQARAQAALNEGANVFGFFEPGWFIKLRELSLTFTAPTRWAGRFGASRMSLTLAGRNLWTITDYSGVDPEVNAFGQSNFATSDFESQPQVTYWVARLNVGF
jgi:TonB-linked SusC/RagA family outer membrane protein